MAGNSLILICASLIVTQIALVSSDEFDYSTIQDDIRKLAGGLRKKCIAETGVTEAILNDAEIGEFAEDRKLACYLKCVMEKGGVLKKDGKINFKIIGKMMPQAFKKIAMSILDECRDISGADNCEVAFNFYKCLFNANPVAYFVV